MIGGAEIWGLNLLRALTAFDPVILTQAQIGETYSSLAIAVHHFDDYGCCQAHLYSARNIYSYARAIKRVASLERPDVIFGVMHNGTLFLAVAATLFRLKGLVMGSILGHLSAYFQDLQRAPSLYEKLLLRHCFRRLNGIITPSEGVRQDLVDHYGAIPDRVRTIYNGFDLKAIRMRATEPLACTKKGPWIVSSCRLGPEKDFATLLKAFRIVRDRHQAKLVIVGDGPLRQAILTEAEVLGLSDDVILTGFKVNPFPYLAKGDVFILSSFFEGFGNVIVEAMALGIPVIASRCPCGPQEIIQDGDNGFLVPVGDAQEMAQKCLMLIEDSSLRAAVSEGGLQRSADFSLEVKAREFEEYLKEKLPID